MTKLSGDEFKNLYMGLFEILSHSSERPSTAMLKRLYSGVGNVPGFSRFSLETFSELIGLAQQECKFMPTPSWFIQRSQELSAPGRQAAWLSLPGGVEESDSRVVPDAFDAGLDMFKKKQLGQIERAKNLIASDKARTVDPVFRAWVEENIFELTRGNAELFKRAAGNRERLAYLLTMNPSTQLRYIQHLDGPEDSLDSYLKELRKRQGVLVRQ